MTSHDIAFGGARYERPSLDLPIATHTYVLGVDIYVKQSGHHEGGVVDRIEAYGHERQHVMTARLHRDMAAWARRNLFAGQPTVGREVADGEV